LGKVWIKNAWGVFHYPVRSWLCEELWTTLDAAQVRQGAIEALKMDVCLVPAGLKRWKQGLPSDMVAHSRTLKEQVCRKDPYDSVGPRKILNFGHTFGHAYESLTRFRLAHGDAVALGMLQALEIGASLGVTPSSVAQEIEEILYVLGAPTRHNLEALTRRHGDKSIFRTISFDKKGATPDGATMVLLSGIGKTRTQWVEWKTL
jgi:3-dehydroquinate synthase